MWFPYHRTVVIGVTGSGKSTLARRLAEKISAECVELDALYWEPNWTAAPEDVFRARVERATRARDWVAAGNYHVVRDIVWPRAEAVIWLDYPLWTVFCQLLVRTLRRWWYREELWNGNRETLWKQLKFWSAQDSLFHWLFKTYRRRRREYPLLLGLPEHSHLVLKRFAIPQETERWLATLEGLESDSPVAAR